MPTHHRRAARHRAPHARAGRGGFRSDEGECRVTLPAQTPPESETKRARQALVQTEAQDALDERKKLHLVAAKISEMNWGKGLSNEMQRAVAMYCRQNLIDPTEIDVLGGNV